MFHEDDEDGIFDDDESPPPSPPEMGKHPFEEPPPHLTSPQRRMAMLKRKILRRAMKPLQARAMKNRMSLNKTTGSVSNSVTATPPLVSPVVSSYLENINSNNEIGGGREEEESPSSSTAPTSGTGDDLPPSSLAKLSVTSWLR